MCLFAPVSLAVSDRVYPEVVPAKHLTIEPEPRVFVVEAVRLLPEDVALEGKATQPQREQDDDWFLQLDVAPKVAGTLTILSLLLATRNTNTNPSLASKGSQLLCEPIDYPQKLLARITLLYLHVLVKDLIPCGLLGCVSVSISCTSGGDLLWCEHHSCYGGEGDSGTETTKDREDHGRDC